MYRTAGGLALAVAWFLLLVLPGGAAATVYEWTDAGGNVHFTDDLTRVPDEVRDRAETVPLPESPAAPAPRAETPPAEAAGADDAGADGDPASNEALDAYTACRQTIEKTRDEIQKSLTRDQAQLEDLNRRIHYSSKSRFKNEMQRERAAVRKRIADAQERLGTEVPRMEWECERKRPYTP